MHAHGPRDRVPHLRGGLAAAAAAGRAGCCATASRPATASAWMRVSSKARRSTVHYDPLLAKLIAHGATREEARRAADRRARRVRDPRAAVTTSAFLHAAARAAGVPRVHGAHALHRRRDSPNWPRRPRRTCGRRPRRWRRLSASRDAAAGRRDRPTTSAQRRSVGPDRPGGLVTTMPKRLQIVRRRAGLDGRGVGRPDRARRRASGPLAVTREGDRLRVDGLAGAGRRRRGRRRRRRLGHRRRRSLHVHRHARRAARAIGDARSRRVHAADVGDGRPDRGQARRRGARRRRADRARGDENGTAHPRAARRRRPRRPLPARRPGAAGPGSCWIWSERGAAMPPSPSTKSGPATDCRTKPRRVRRRPRSRSSIALSRGGPAGHRGVGLREPAAGCRRWPTPPRCSPASRAGRARAMPRSCRTCKGLDRALAAGVTDVAVFAAASETFSRRNINQSIDESLARYARRHSRGAGGRPARARVSVHGVRLSVRGRRAARSRRRADPDAARHRRVRGRRQRHDRHRASRPGQAGADGADAGRCRRRRSRCTFTTRAARRSPTCSRRSSSTSGRSTRRPAASADARTRRAPRAISRPKICSTCCTASGYDTGVSLDALIAASAAHRTARRTPAALALLPRTLGDAITIMNHEAVKAVKGLFGCCPRTRLHCLHVLHGESSWRQVLSVDAWLEACRRGMRDR